LQTGDKEAAAVATAPRVSLADIEGEIAERYDLRADRALGHLEDERELFNSASTPPHPLRLLSICILVLRNGFTIIGKSAPASAQNFNAELGKKLAYEDAIRQIWPLMGFALRERLSKDSP
jgi:hypothetical protein